MLIDPFVGAEHFGISRSGMATHKVAVTVLPPAPSPNPATIRALIDAPHDRLFFNKPHRIRRVPDVRSP
jgi:hypothetical protein